MKNHIQLIRNKIVDTYIKLSPLLPDEPFLKNYNVLYGLLRLLSNSVTVYVHRFKNRKKYYLL